MKRLLLIAFLIVRTAQALVGGAYAKPGDFPAIALIKVGESEICTAAKIGPLHFLTAGHCAIERNSGLQKLNKNGKLREVLEEGATLSYETGVEHDHTKPWPHQAKVARTFVHTSYHYSAYEAPALRPELAPDIAVIVLESENSGLGEIPLSSEPQKVGIPVIKIGFGCEQEEKATLQKCRKQEESRKLKFHETELAEPYDTLERAPKFAFDSSTLLGRLLQQSISKWYTFTKGRYFNGNQNENQASLGSFDSGGPLLAENAFSALQVVGVNSRGALLPAESGDEHVVFDLHTRLDAESGSDVAAWLARILSWRPGNARPDLLQILESPVSLSSVSKSDTTWEERDSRARPSWHSVRAYLQMREHETGKLRIKITGSFCPLVLEAVRIRTAPREEELVINGKREAENGTEFTLPVPSRIAAIHPVFTSTTPPDPNGSTCRLSAWID